MKQGSKIGIVCCSNGLKQEQADTINMLIRILEGAGFVPVLSPFLYEDENGSAGTARDRARVLMEFYQDDSVEEIFDVSGGDMANEILPYLDFQVISYGKKHFWGYSDLTTILNAIYARTGKSSVLYQVKNLTCEHNQEQLTAFLGTTLAGTSALYDFPCEFLQGSHMEGMVVGGNIRCLLKLAGYPLLARYAGKNPASGILGRKGPPDDYLPKPAAADRCFQKGERDSSWYLYPDGKRGLPAGYGSACAEICGEKNSCCTHSIYRAWNRF